MSNLKRSFFKYVSLSVLSTLSLSFYILVDTYFISVAEGSNGIAALNISLPVYGILYGIGNMIGVGFSTRFKIKYDDYDEKCAIFSKGLFFAVAISLLFTMIGIFLSHTIVYTLGARGEVLRLSNIYLKTILCFAPAFILDTLLMSFIRNDKNPSIVTTAVVTSSIFNCICDYIFMFPMKMGIFGAAFATAIAPVVGIAVILSHFVLKKNSFRLVKTKIKISEFFYLSSLGISSLITNISTSVVLIVFNFIILKYIGDIGVAAYGIIANMSDVTFSIFSGVGNGVQPLISENYGKKKYDEMIYVLKMAITVSLVMAITIYAILYFNAVRLTDIFNSSGSKELSFYGVQGIRVYFLAIPFIAINIVTALSMQAMEKPRLSFFISILRGIVVLIPSAIIFSNLFEILGLWSSYVFTEFVVCVISLIFMLKYVRTKEVFGF